MTPGLSLPPQLPRSLAPQVGETLSGYLLNLAYRLGYRPIDLAHRVGLKHKATATNIGVGFAVGLPRDVAAQFAHACHLSDEEVTGLTLERWDGLLFNKEAPSKAARTAHGTGWFIPYLTRACPACLAEHDPALPNRVTWQAQWKTPWAVACIHHDVLLADTCTGCGLPFGASGSQGNDLVPNPTFQVTHPAACRSRTEPGVLCGYRTDRQAAQPAPKALFVLQRRLNALLEGTTANTQSLGVSVSPAQYLRDLRAMAVLLQFADYRPATGALPQEFYDALTADLDARNVRRTTRRKNDCSDRTWTHPPTDTRVLAALLHHAAAILDLSSPEDVRDVLPPLVQAANERERTWMRLRSAAQPSDGLFRYFAPKRAGTFSVHMLRAACPTPLTITCDHVPAYLDERRYERWFATFNPSEQRNIRRAVPIAITQLIEGCDVDIAAAVLGIPFVSAHAALIRAGRACKRTGRDDEFRRLIGVAAEDLQVESINYGHRRRYFDTTWDIPENDWQHLRDALLAARLARVDSPWERRRTDLCIWLWSEITSGDPVLAPMIRTRSAVRRSTGLAISSYTTLRRRAAPALEQIVHCYAASLAAQIDLLAD